MDTTISIAARTGAALLVLGSLATAQTWVASEDFSDSANPNGVWSYGWSASLGGAFQLAGDTQSFPSCDFVPGWNTSGMYYGHPSVGTNRTSATECCGSYLLPPQRLLLHPGFQGEYAVLRFTAPADGDYRVDVDFSGIELTKLTSSDVAVLSSSVPLFTDLVNGYYGPPDCGSSAWTPATGFGATLTLLAGDTVDFAVGYGSNGTFWGDSTLVEPVVTRLADPVVYCTAKTGSIGCLPQVGWQGVPGTTQPGAFDVTCGQVLNNKNGLFFYGVGGRAALPFLGGTLCVMPPLKRTPVQTSGGNPPPDDCSGTYAFDFNAWIQGGNHPGFVPGTTVDGQYWYRDPADPAGSGLSDGIEFVMS